MKVSRSLMHIFLALTMASCKKESADGLTQPDYPDIGADILISEILPDPLKDGEEFIELYNRSEKVFDLSQYAIASANSKGTTGTARSISKSTLYFYPGTYKLLSRNPASVMAQYPVPQTIETVSVENFPQLTNSEGAVLLLKGDETIDSLHYTEKMHDELIRNPKGVSLERVSFRKPTNSQGNFISASATAGYASPGYENSQRENSETKGPAVHLSKQFLSRNKKETIAIQFNLPVGGKMVNIAVFSSAGSKVHQLVQNHRLGTLDQLHWDGQAANGRKLPVGPYYIHIEIYDTSGYLQHYKEVCFLSD